VRRRKAEEGSLDSLHAEAADDPECDAQTSHFLALCSPSDLGTLLLTFKTVASSLNEKRIDLTLTWISKGQVVL
jgi:hypothetical protein